MGTSKDLAKSDWSRPSSTTEERLGKQIKRQGVMLIHLMMRHCDEYDEYDHNDLLPSRLIEIEEAKPKKPDPYQITKKDGEAERAVKQFYATLQVYRKWTADWWKNTGSTMMLNVFACLVVSFVALVVIHAVAFVGFNIWTTYYEWDWLVYLEAGYFEWVCKGLLGAIAFLCILALGIGSVFGACLGVYHGTIDLFTKMPFRIARLVDRIRVDYNKTWVDDFDM